jgi:serine protease SohB
MRSTLRERFGDKIRTPLVSAERTFFGRRIPGVGASSLVQLWSRPGFPDEIVSAIEARALWARYGL